MWLVLFYLASQVYLSGTIRGDNYRNTKFQLDYLLFRALHLALTLSWCDMIAATAEFRFEAATLLPRSVSSHIFGPLAAAKPGIGAFSRRFRRRSLVTNDQAYFLNDLILIDL